MGAAYSLLNFAAVPRVSAAGRARCNDCMDCFAVCPEPQVIRPALKGSGSPVIGAINCTTCGRCADVCSQSVFRITTRFDHRRDPHEQDAPEAPPYQEEPQYWQQVPSYSYEDDQAWRQQMVGRFNYMEGRIEGIDDNLQTLQENLQLPME